ncbi:MAG: CBS domain-containing protein [Alphaproteobacteria bacterium]|nr:CBS domain-containing protein [Alphaproteobacteria bacterium]
MHASDIMTEKVITVGGDSSITDVANLLLKHGISAVPVVDDAGNLLGLVSEGDLMRRLEGETDTKGSWWLGVFSAPHKNVSEFVKTEGRKASDVMTREVISITPDTAVSDIARLLENNRIKRVPVVDNGQLVGIVSRANLLHGLAATTAQSASSPNLDDRALRGNVMQALADIDGLHVALMNVTVHDGGVHLWGDVETDKEQRAARIAAENVDGVKSVESHLGRSEAARTVAWAWGP